MTDLRPPEIHTAATAVPGLLTCRGLCKRFGGVVALENLDLSLGPGELVGIIGPNGAGKSTLLNLIAAVQRPSAGEIELDGTRIDRLPRAQVARMGVGLAHQIPHPFGAMTVAQNLLVAGYSCRHRVPNPERHVSTVLELCGLASKCHLPARSLQLLDLKRLEVARALAINPRVLLLDEVAAGLTAGEIGEVVEMLRAVHQQGTAMLVVEHVQTVVESLAQRVVVLNWGHKIAEGQPTQIARDPVVIDVYMGSRSARETRSRAVAPVQKVSPPVLRVEEVSVSYGPLRALDHVSCQVAAGEIVAVLGPNGAGKTTLSRAIAGIVPVAGGRIYLEETDITKMPAHKRARLGVAIVHEGGRLFREMTVRENLELGGRYRSQGDAARAALDQVYELFPKLAEWEQRVTATLSGGYQQMLAISRALMARPKVLILDELSLGLAPHVIEDIYQALERIQKLGVSMLLIEQNVHRTLEICDRVYVLERGRVTLTGMPQVALQHPGLRAAYLGSQATGS
jgi:branched-chain amino acid transport system ATP-binding protein